jgi:hypothetical protein
MSPPAWRARADGASSGKTLLDRGAAGLEGFAHPLVAAGGLTGRAIAVGLVATRIAAVDRLAALIGAFEQGIALELAIHIGRQVQIRQLQQLDGLHQLRRHHQRLALTDLQSL